MVLEDEDMISPTTVFQGMPTWDSVMAQPVAERMQSFRDPEIRRKLSVGGGGDGQARTPIAWAWRNGK